MRFCTGAKWLVSYCINTIGECESLCNIELDSHSLLLRLLADAEEQGSLRHSAFSCTYSVNNQQDEVVGEKDASWTEKEADPANPHQFANLAHFIQNIYTDVSCWPII